MFELPPQVQYVLDKLNNAGFEAYLVGGGVRDALMGFAPKDFDITTSALPEQTELVFAAHRLIETGMKHGTVTVLIDDMPLEITTYRIDGEYSDNRHPDKVSFTSFLKDDLSRRDFTVNALAYHPLTGITDLFDGQKDIKHEIIRCVGIPAERFREDALRIMRALRFSSVLGFTIDPATAEAIHAEKRLLKNVSAERIYSEFVKLLCGKNARRVLDDYIDVIGVFIPQVLSMQNCSQNCVYHCFDVLHHTTASIEAAPAEHVLRLAAFFHDIGKPACRTTDEAGNDHFYGHCAVSAEIAEQVLKELRADAKTVQTVTQLVLHHDTPITETEKSVKRAMNKLTAEGFYMMLDLKRADTLAHASACHERLSVLDNLKAIADEVIRKQDCFSLRQLAVNGDDLIALGMVPGKEIGDRLHWLLDAVVDGKVENEKQLLLDYLENHE